jgi:hypothetical protein
MRSISGFRSMRIYVDALSRYLKKKPCPNT